MAIRQESAECYFQHWQNKVNQRYYFCYIARDLFNDWILTLAYGGMGTKSGAITHHYCQTIEQALTKMEAIATKRKRRGYVLVLQKSNPPSIISRG
jgi:predicted DNA-binding WGR domain protein